MADASGTFITKLKASLADSSKGWVVQGVFVDTQQYVTDVSGSVSGGGGVTSNLALAGFTVAATPIFTNAGNPVQSAQVPGFTMPSLSGGVSGGSPVTGSVASTNVTKTIMSVTLYGANVKLNLDDPRGIQILYQSIWINGAFSEGQISVNQARLRSTDSALDTTIRSLGSTFLTATDAVISAIL